MEQETITRKGGEVIYTPVEELESYEMANIQINTYERQAIVIKNDAGFDIMTLYCINGSVDRVVFWSVGGEPIEKLSWFTSKGEVIRKEIDRMKELGRFGESAVTYLTKGMKR